MVSEKFETGMALQALALTGGLGLTVQSAATKCWRTTDAKCVRTDAGWQRDKPYPSGDGRLPSGGLMWRDCAVVQTAVFAPVQETLRWQGSRYWLVQSGVAGGAPSRSGRLWRQHSSPVR